MWLRVLLVATLVVTGCVPAADAPTPFLAPTAPIAVAAPAASPLSVTAVVPEPNASAVLFDSAVFVQFNKPVVPLTTLDHPRTDVPLQIEPAVDGSGKWISTGLYTFTPAEGWSPSTTYQLRVPQTDYAWSFTTLPPAVASTQPAPGARFTDPAASVRVTFNQPVDPDAVSFHLTPQAPGASEWTDRRTLVFHPIPALAPGTQYAASVSLGGVSSTHTWQFTTAPAPSVVRSIPEDGQEALHQGRLELFFSAPMDRDDVRARLQLDPPPDYPPYLNWTDDDTHVTVSGPMKRSTRYTLVLPAGVQDRFGRPTTDEFRMEFQTPAGDTSPKAELTRPQAWLISPGAIGTYNAYDHPRALLRTTNVTHFAYSVDELDEPTVVGVSRRGVTTPIPDGRRVASGAKDLQPERNVPGMTEIDLGELPPGYYRLRIEPKEAAAAVRDQLVVVTRTMLAVKESQSQVLVWARDLRSGAPLADVPVRLLRQDAATPVATGKTDADGALRIDVPPAAPNGMGTFAVLDRPDDVAIGLSHWTGGLGPWTFGRQTTLATPETIAHAYTDRPIYRPGQTVHLKGVVRADNDARYSLPATFSAPWRSVDSQGRMVSSGTIDRLSEFGTFDVDLAIGPEAATGMYTFTLGAGEKLRPGEVPIATTSFQVAEYQRPDFEVNFDRATDVVAGQQLGQTVRAAYYFGQPVRAAPVHWQVRAQPFAFSWPLDPSFRFGDLDQAVSMRTIARPDNAARAEGIGSTRSDGSFAFQVPTDLSRDTASQRFTIEATVTDADHGDVSNRHALVVHKAGLYLGLRPSTFVGQAAKQHTVELVTLDVQGALVPNVSVQGQVVRRRWLSVRERDAQGELRWISRPQDTPVSTFEARSGIDGRSTFGFSPTEGGEYRIVVEAPDAAGNVARTAMGIWVAGAGFIPWRIDTEGRLGLQADQAAYAPGDTAHVLVPAPIADATALISVERGKLISHSVRRLAGNSSVIDIPLGMEHIPNVFVSVVLFGGGDTPALFNGYVELAVSSAEHKLVVSAEPDRREHAPGDMVAFTIRTRDAHGQGMPAELSVALVDAAVLALADSRNDPHQTFWGRRPLAVRSGSSLGVSIDRMNEAVSSGLKGGGGSDLATVRQDFPDTAFWQSAIRTDAHGEARVEIRLPDTLTTWRLTAVAVTRDTRLGVANSEVVTSKPLLLRPLTPRFLVGGDALTLGAIVHNTTASELAVTGRLSASGVLLRGDPARSIDVPAGGQARLDWPVTSTVGQTGQAKLHFEVAGAGLADAVQLSLPLLAWGASSTVATAGEVAPAETTTETVQVPSEVDHQRGELRVEVAPTLAGALRASLRQVEEYPYECLEQTLSRFVPRLAFHRAINGLGLADSVELGAELPGLVTRSIGRVYRYQHSDGGWGWWRDDPSQPYLSAYALFSLVEARRAGFTVDQGVIDRAVTYLRRWLNGEPDSFGLDTRAYVVYVLGNAGAAEPNRAGTLFDRRADLGVVGRAYLAQALATIHPADHRVGGLLAELTGSAVVSATGSHWEEANASIKPWIMGTGVRTTAAVLHALVRLRPDHPLVPSTVRWLMAERRDHHGYWPTTHDTAMSLLALTDYLAASGELAGSYEWQVGLNGQPRESGVVSNPTNRLATPLIVAPMTQLRDGDNRLDLIRSTGPGRLYYTVQLTLFSGAEDMPFVNRGFTVAREYLPLGGSASAQPVHQLRVGELVQVKVTVMAPSELHDVLIEDPLPAGLEALDTKLKTTSVAVAAKVQDARTPGWQPWTHVDVRSDKVALFATYLTRGAHQYTYVARAVLPGDYHVLPTSGREQYFPEVFARGDGRRFTVLP